MTPSAPAAEPMPVDQSTALAEFARACKSAARSVSLYPGTHPAIRASLSRVTAAAKRLTTGGDVTLAVHPDMLLVDGRVPARADLAIGELASLLHDRLIGELCLTSQAEAEDWHSLLLILARTPEELIQEGGVAKAWSASGRTRLDIRQIDYAEVLRERAGGKEAAWDRIIACCLQGESATLDDRALAALVASVSDPEQFSELIARLQAAPTAAGNGIGATVAALLQLLRTALDTASAHRVDTDRVLDTMATSVARLTPEMLLGVLAARKAGNAEDGSVASSVIDRMTDDNIAGFVANSVAADHGATERLAHAFEALVPESERKERVLQVAEEKARATGLGTDANFQDLWQKAADMLTSYSDKKYVSDEYGRELSAARTRAVEVERVSDDPPERVQQWLDSISDAALRQLDVQLLIDLLRIEDDPVRWSALAAIVASEGERRAVLGELANAADLVCAIVREQQSDGRSHLAPAASAIADRLSSSPLVRHVVGHLRAADDEGAASAARLCHMLGAAAVRPLAEALAVEENTRAIRALREILLDFGAVGRSSVEQLKTSTNPAVRRTAIDLLRVFGGDEALPELASMLSDADEQVQRDAVRAIVQIGSDGAYAVLQRALATGGASRDTVINQLISLRDNKAIPLLCHVLATTAPTGAMADAHLQIMEALGSLQPHEQSTQALRLVLYRDTWWAPFKTARLRQAAATALMRIGAPETIAVLDEAAQGGSRRVRKVARTIAATAVRRRRGAA